MRKLVYYNPFLFTYLSFRSITPRPICEDALRMPAEVFIALETENQEEMNPGKRTADEPFFFALSSHYRPVT